MSFTSSWDLLETRLDTIDGLRISDGDMVNPPAAIVDPDSPGANYDDDFDGSATHRFTITIAVQGASLRAAKAELDDYIDPTGAKSVKAAVEGAATATVRQMTRVGRMEIAGNTYVVAQFAAEVLDDA